jgi:hypothetical protein
LPRSTTTTTRLYHISTVPPVVIQLRLYWSFPRGVVVLITPPYQEAFYLARPPSLPPLRMSPLGGLFSEVLHQEGQDRHHKDPHQHQHQY